VSSSIGWGKRFGEDFARIYKKKGNKRSDMEMDEIVGETYIKVVSMLR
jgi:hypothetical protein